MSVVKLPNGYQVSYACYAATCNTLASLCNESPEAAIGLLEKCYDVKNPERFPQHKSALRSYHLIDDEGRVDPDIQAIALATIETHYNEKLKLVPTFRSVTSWDSNGGYYYRIPMI
jgi:hypothetical protein